ncbi:MAG: 2Fe-2S iron-sulfur cluster binding domain-containing protein, partial [Aquificae bacterium]|nr:2Fe-2S iron-sulfur cluster binding domain-containing protein [Aquificota bacterium]
MKKVKVIIDGTPVEVPEGTTVLEAAKKINKIIPTFCYHDKLPIFGGCRMCLVWDKKWKSSIIACGTKVYDGMEIETENEEVLKDRRFILEMLFSRHPLDCPVCDKAGECDLQNWGTYYGPQKNPYDSITPFDKKRPEENWESDYLEFVSNRCVLCLRCVSVCEHVNGASALFQKERGFEILISPDKKPMDTESSCEFCGLCVDICPVGAILFKPFKYKARPWLLKETISRCGMCSLQCPVAIDHDEQNIYRIRSTADLQICAGAYLGYDIQNKNRLKGALKNGSSISFDEAIKEVVSLINENPEKTAIVVSPYSTNESIQIIKKIAEKTGVYLTSTITTDTLPTLQGFEEETEKEYKLPTEEDLLNAEKIVVLGNDIANINPVLSYFFHKNFFEGREIGKDKKIFYMGR